MNAKSVLFCPFCRESFEGISHCPTHDLELVAFRELGVDIEGSHDTDPLALADPRYGRGLVFAGAVLTLLAFALPLASLSGQVSMSNTMFELARGHARLWLVPLAACSELVVLHRRRSPALLRGARLTVLVFAVLPSVAVLSTLWGVREAAQLMSERMHSRVEMHIGIAAWLVWLAAVPLLVGALKLGVRPMQRVKVRRVEPQR